MQLARLVEVLALVYPISLPLHVTLLEHSVNGAHWAHRHVIFVVLIELLQDALLLHARNCRLGLQAIVSAHRTRLEQLVVRASCF